MLGVGLGLTDLVVLSRVPLVTMMQKPAGLGWNDDLYPITVQKAAGAYSIAEDPKSFVSPDIWIGTEYWVDVAAGNNASDGLTQGTAKKAIHSAITAGNATGAPYRVNVKAGSYHRDHSFNSNAGTVVPTQPCAVLAHEGRVTSGQFSETHTWAADATYTNTYSSNRSNVLRVLDRLALTDAGDMVELTKVADAAACNSTENSWAQVGSTLYVNRADSAPVSHVNTRTILVGWACMLGNFDIYLEGIDFEGGSSVACMNATQTATRNVIGIDCTFKYAGTETTAVNGVQLNNMTGLALFVGSAASANSNDGFNGHAVAGDLSLITVNCTGNDNGRGSSVSNNGWTVHEGIRAIDLGGSYNGNRDGSDVHIVNSSKAWLLGTSVVQSPDAANSDNGCFTASDTSEMWLENTSAAAQSGSAKAVWAASAGSVIHKRNHATVQGVETAVGTIDTF